METQCTYSAEQLFSYMLDSSEGKLDESIAEHLENCVTCSALLMKLKSVENRLGRLADASPSQGFENTLAASCSMPINKQRKQALKSLGPYEILEEIGRGGMGVVLKAFDKSLNREVALKVMRADAYKQDEWRKRFIEEAQITGQLEHPGIAPVHLLGTNSKGHEFFSMKLMSGKTLAEILIANQKFNAKNTFPLPRLLSIFERVCETVEFAHSHGIIHRDLKPANIMIGDHGEVWVIDWGLAKPVEHTKLKKGIARVQSIRDATGQLTTSGSVVGTPSYMPPEQALGETLDVGADIYSLGAILYEILTGAPPAEGKSINDILSRVAKGRIKPIKATMRGRRQPKELIAICMKCLKFERKDRYGSAVELIQDIRSYGAGDRISVLPDTRWDCLVRFVMRHKTQVVAGISIGAMICIVLTVGALYIASQQRRARAAEELNATAEREVLKAAKIAAEFKEKAFEAQSKQIQQQLTMELERSARIKKRNDAFQPYARAMDLLGRGQRLDEAKKLAIEALSIDSEFIEAQFAIAEILRSKGLVKEAAEAYIQTDKLNLKIVGRSNPRALLTAAFLFEKYDHYDMYQTLLRVEALPREEPLVDIGRAYLFALQGKIIEADALLQSLLTSAPHLWELYYVQVQYQRMAAVEFGFLDPREFEANATKMLKMGLKLAPNESILQMEFALINKDLTLIDEIISKFPNDGHLLLQRGNVRKLFNVSGADEDIARAKQIGISPLISEHAGLMGSMNWRAPGTEEFGRKLNALLTNVRKASPTHLSRVVATAINTGRYYEVASDYEYLQTCYPQAHDSKLLKVYFLLYSKKPLDAAKIATDGLKTYRYSPLLFMALADCHYNTKNFQQAVDACDKAIVLDPWNRFYQVRRFRLMCLAKLGRVNDIRAGLKEIERVFPAEAEDIKKFRKALDDSGTQ
jgi:serine/threonine protein kinase/tetratricopeptide (TPR) repeat protein